MYLEEALSVDREPLGYAKYGRVPRGTRLVGSFRRDPDQFENWAIGQAEVYFCTPTGCPSRKTDKYSASTRI